MGVENWTSSRLFHSLPPGERNTVTAFAEALERGSALRLGDFVKSRGERSSPKMLAALACVEMEHAWSSLAKAPADLQETLASVDQPLSAAGYLEAFPEIKSEPDGVVELIALEHQCLLRTGNESRIAEHLRRFPHLAGSIERRLAEPDEQPTISLDRGAAAKNEETVSIARSFDASTHLPLDQDRPRAARPSLGQREFGDYILLEEIARGGMGVVYKAVQKRLNRTVAVKMILSGNLATEQEVRRFYTEAEAAAHLDHPGIVPIYEVNEVHGQHFFSMGYVDGQSLADRLRQGPLPPREAAEIVRQTAQAITYAHAQGVVHRDLKPSNILMTQDGRPRVTDFGLAKTVQGDGNLTASGQILGTPNYMPPEQALGEIHAVGPHSDVYSLGAVLYCLLTARPPFQAATPVETLRQVIERDPARPRLLNPAVDIDLETICLKCLEKDQNHRIESAAELAAELERYLSGESIHSRRVGPATRAVRWIKRNRAVAAAVGLFLILLLATPLAFSVYRFATESRDLSRASNAVEAKLDQIELTPAWLDETERLIGDIASLDAEMAGGFGKRVTETWAAQIERSIRRPRLRAQDVRQLENALALLEDRDGEAAVRLAADLARRKSQWQDVFRLEPPFDQNGVVFAPGAVEVRGGKLFPRFTQARGANRKPQSDVRSVATEVPSRPRSQLEALFDENWEQGVEIGLSLNHSENSGYDFVLYASPAVTVEREIPLAAAHAPAQARPRIADARPSGKAVIEIRRKGSPAQRREMPLEAIRRGPLRLWFKREGGRLLVQVNQSETIEFLDPFPLADSRAGVFALRWPEEAGLLSLAAAEELRSDATTPLEQADAAFEEGRLDEALAIYSQQILQLADREFQQEARFKQGLCLVRLNRADEAIQVFQPLVNEPGDRWPPQAGVQLWLTLLRQDRDADADVMYELLASRYTFEQLALMVPADVRNEILQNYLKEMSSVQHVLSYRPERLRNLERAAAIDRLLSYDGRGDMMTQIELSRGYRYVDDLPSALQILEPIVRSASHTVPWRHYLRVLRQMGDHEKALAECDRWMTAPDADRLRLPMLLNRAQIHAARKDWRSAEADVLEGLNLHAQQSRRDGEEPTYFHLMAGFLCEERGDEPGAQARWRYGFLDQRRVLKTNAVASTGYVNVLLMGALCGELTDDETWEFGQKAIGGVNNPIANLALAFVNRQVVGNTARRAVATPRGRRIVRDFAFDALSLSQRVQAPVKLAGVQFASDAAFGGNLWPEQEEVLWGLSDDGYRRFTEEGTINTAQVMQLGFAWKGTSNLLGWQGVAPGLDAEFRAPVAYVLAHRYVRLGDLAQAERFLQTAAQDAAPESTLAKLASEELPLLQSKQARLRIEREPADAEGALPLEVVLRRGGQEVQRVTLTGSTELDLEAGDYEAILIPADDDFIINPNRVKLAAADRAVIAVQSRWRSPPAEAILPGLLSQPADLPNVGRWQVIGAASWSTMAAIDYSPDGQWIAVAGGSHDGIVRLYDRQLRLKSALPATRRNILDQSWSPDGARLIVAGQDSEADIWDPVLGRIVARLAGATGGFFCVAWSPQGDRIVSGHWDDSLCLWSADGKLLKQQNPGWSDVLRVAWSPDGREVAFTTLSGARLGRWELESGAIEPLSSSGDIIDVAFSPDGKRLAVLASPGLEIWEWPARERLRTFSIPPGRLSSAIWTPDGQSVWMRQSGFLHRFEVDLPNEEPAQTIPLDGDGAMAFDPQTRGITAAIWGRLLSHFDPAGGEPNPAPAINTYGFRSIAFHPGGERFVAAGDPRLVRWFDRNGSLLRQVETPGHPLTASYGPDGTLVAVPCDNGMVLLLNDADGALIREWKAHQAPAQSAAIDPQGERIATCGDDRQVRLWTVEGESLPLEEGDAPRERRLAFVSFSPDGARLLATNHEGDVILWDREGSLVAQFRSGKYLPAFAWRGDGGKFALAMDNTLRLYSSDGAEEGTIAGFSGIVAIAWNENQILTIDQEGNFGVWSEAGERLDSWTTSVNGWRLASFDAQAERLVLSRAVGRLESWRLADRRPAWTTILAEDKSFTFDGRGRLQNEDATDIAPLKYLVETPDGFRLLTHEEFQTYIHPAPP